jgi:hypothetical protein
MTEKPPILGKIWGRFGEEAGKKWGRSGEDFRGTCLT